MAPTFKDMSAKVCKIICSIPMPESLLASSRQTDSYKNAFVSEPCWVEPACLLHASGFSISEIDDIIAESNCKNESETAVLLFRVWHATSNPA